MVVEHLTWDWLAALDMTFAGLGGGAFLVAAITSLYTGDKYRELLKFGSYLAAPFVILGVIMLAAELGHPERAILIYSNPTSMVTIGSSILSIFIIVGIVYITFLPPDSLPWLRAWLPWSKYTNARHVVEAIGIPLAVGTNYTGILLAVASAKPVWNTFLLPTMFFFSAVFTGLMAIGLLLAVLYPTKLLDDERTFMLSLLRKVSRAGIALGVITLVLALAYVWTMLGSSSTLASESANLLVAGSLSQIFIGGFIGLGLIIPMVLCGLMLVMKVKTRGFPTAPLLLAVGAILTILGNPLMRYAILAAGQLVI